MGGWSFLTGDAVRVFVGADDETGEVTTRTGKVIAAAEDAVTIRYDDDGSEEVFGQDAPELAKAQAQ